MDFVVDTLFNTRLTLFQRVVVLYAFIFLGFLVAVQVSQTQAEHPLSWTRLNKTTKYVFLPLFTYSTPMPKKCDIALQVPRLARKWTYPAAHLQSKVLLLFVSTWPILQHKMAGYVNGYEERILNTVWVGLLSLETLMVLGVAVQGIIKRFGPKPKQKTN
ncbi:hypothetical protein HJFPF1_08832 [Paramyrothecium foliicola]|nr:hypothetical protein HJFPF1_08832 [Paramyrothecium foliicola]